MFEFLDALFVTKLSPSNMQRRQCNPNSRRSNLNTVFCASFASILPIPPLGISDQVSVWFYEISVIFNKKGTFHNLRGREKSVIGVKNWN